MPTPRRQSTVRMNLEALYDRLLPSAIAGHLSLPAGQASASVRLVDSQNTVLDQQTVAANGYYLLADTDVGNGACRVEMLGQCGWEAANGTSTTIVTNRTGNVSQAAAAVGKITGQLSIKNSAGTIISAPASEVGVAVQATGPNGVVRVALPDSSGAYTFSNLPAGAYTVTAIRLDNTNDGIAADGNTTVTVGTGTVTADTKAKVTASVTISASGGVNDGEVIVRIVWKNCYGIGSVYSGVFGQRGPGGPWNDLYGHCPEVSGASGDSGDKTVITTRTNKTVDVQCRIFDSQLNLIAEDSYRSGTR